MRVTTNNRGNFALRRATMYKESDDGVTPWTIPLCLIRVSTSWLSAEASWVSRPRCTAPVCFPQLRLLLVEKEDSVARHQSGHNSGVIHSGVYYKPGSLKAKLCVEGAAAMVEFCREHNLKYEVCGKVIVATNEEEIPGLKNLLERGQANGLVGLRMLEREQVREVEPHCSAVLGLLVPSTGITDYAAVPESTRKLWLPRAEP